METFALTELSYKTQIPEWFIVEAFKPYEKLAYLVDGHVFIKATPELLVDLITNYILQLQLNKTMLKKMMLEQKKKELRLLKLN